MTMPVDLDAIRPIAGADPDRDTRAENVDRAVQGAELLLRQGVVVGVDVPNGRCSVVIGGDTDNPVPGVKHLSNYRPQVADSCWILVNGYDLLVLDRTTNLGPSVISDAQSATVVASDFTTSTLWTPLAGPLLNGISVSPSGRLLVQVSALLYNLASGSYGALMGVNLVHSTIDFSVPPIETSSQITYGTAANAATAASKVILFTGLPAGAYSAQAMYLSLNGGGAQFQYRHIWALPL
jgi:hypothetical protein